MDTFLRLVAGIGALAHLFFAYQETRGWNVDFVKKAAPRWIERAGGKEKAGPYVEWAKDLAFNMAAYNLVLAIGLAWVAIEGDEVAGSLGIFLALWLLIAAWAAISTGVRLAFYAQGALGVLLLIAALLA